MRHLPEISIHDDMAADRFLRYVRVKLFFSLIDSYWRDTYSSVQFYFLAGKLWAPQFLAVLVCSRNKLALRTKLRYLNMKSLIVFEISAFKFTICLSLWESEWAYHVHVPNNLRCVQKKRLKPQSSSSYNFRDQSVHMNRRIKNIYGLWGRICFLLLVLYFLTRAQAWKALMNGFR